MNKILCPVDFSDTSLNAIEFAVEIGKKFHSAITLLHIFTEKDFNKIVGEESIGRSYRELLAMATEKVKILADKINEDYAGQGIARCGYKVEAGEVIDTILEITHTSSYDLIVMGTTGISRTNGIFFGSKTEDVMEKVKIPVLCIPDSALYKGFSKLVYASDFMKEDRLAIQEVISFATLFDARISVLHIDQDDSDDEYDAFITELKSFIQYRKINFVNKHFKDDVGQGIEEYMKEENGDLLVVFKKHRSFLDSMLHKSLTKTLAYSTDKPFLVLKLENIID